MVRSGAKLEKEDVLAMEGRLQSPGVEKAEGLALRSCGSGCFGGLPCQ